MTRPTTTSGGKHDVTWADCTGTVYDQAIRPGDAVHFLAHDVTGHVTVIEPPPGIAPT